MTGTITVARSISSWPCGDFSIFLLVLITMSLPHMKPRRVQVALGVLVLPLLLVVTATVRVRVRYHR